MRLIELADVPDVFVRIREWSPVDVAIQMLVQTRTSVWIATGFALAMTEVLGQSSASLRAAMIRSL